MPKTRFQSIVFATLMAFCMVFAMTCYTLSLNMGGLSYQIFAIAIREMWLEYIIVLFLAIFIISKLAMHIAFRLFNPKENKPVLVMLSIQSLTVALMVPTITLIATFIHNGATRNWFTIWIELAFKCFPVALLLQIFYIGPFVRFIFRHIFRAKAA